jgi:hypothetical protein
MKNTAYVSILLLFLATCSKKTATPTPPVTPATFTVKQVTVNGVTGTSFNGLSGLIVIKVAFSAPLNRSTTAAALLITNATGANVPATISYESSDSVAVVQPASKLIHLSRYNFNVLNTVTNVAGIKLQSGSSVNLSTGIDSSNKFPLITDNELLDKIQRTTFKYFWDFAHPTSGLARERNTSGDIVTTGGSGFGIMALIAAADRHFISRADGLARMQKITGFLLTKANKFHGAFPHWLNGNTGSVVPFSTKDDGADLVETSFLIQGLLSARQYFNNAGSAETSLRNDINKIWEGVEWDWFRKNNENVLYWHWSPNYGWDMNLPIKGWNETLITYVLAASSPTHAIPKLVYDNGFAGNGTIKNGKSFYNITLPLGPDYGGPLFFSHYSFLGINPNGLKDAYADYGVQNKNHTLINYNYAVNDPKGNGYSAKLWGLTASDIANGYTASSPTNDAGVIAPTAALSSFPYTPTESMQALMFFYYVLGDKIWKEDGYGFVDAFSVKDLWFADSCLAIDQGPIIAMIENYRSGLLWKLFMSNPEVKTGMLSLGFSSPNL